jgi:hypothetical protein
MSIAMTLDAAGRPRSPVPTWTCPQVGKSRHALTAASREGERVGSRHGLLHMPAPTRLDKAEDDHLPRGARSRCPRRCRRRAVGATSQLGLIRDP